MSESTPSKTSVRPEAAADVGQTTPPQQGYLGFPSQYAQGPYPGYAWPPGMPPGGYNPQHGQQAWGWPQPMALPPGQPHPSSLQYPGHPPQLPPYNYVPPFVYPHTPTGGGTAAPQVNPSQIPAPKRDEPRMNVGEGFVRMPTEEGGRGGKRGSVGQGMVERQEYPGHVEELGAQDEAGEERELLARLQSWSMDSSPPALLDSVESTPASGSVMKVSGLSDDVDQDDVADFFENRKRGGFAVERVELDERSRTALVYFPDPTAVPLILKRGPFMMKKRKLVATVHDPTTGESMQMTGETSEMPENKEYSRMLVVRSLPRGVDEEDVADFFEHRRRGGFTVARVELNQAGASAVVHFEEEEAVDAILQLDVLVWREQELEVVSYAQEQRRLEEESLERERELSRMLVVHGLPRGVDEEDVADFFEHRKRGGFTVARVELNQVAAKAVVHFQEAKAVEAILQLGQLLMQKSNLALHRYDPAIDSVNSRQGARHVLFVSGLPAGKDRDSVQEYFESKRTGGFTVNKVELRPDIGTALVHFQEADAVDAILKKTPLSMSKTTLSICACTPEIEEQFHAQREDDTVVSAKPACVVLQVTELPDPVEEEFLINFFESRRISGGYGVERVELQQKTHSALVYFEDPAAVETVLQKAPHLMNKKQISVSAYTEPPKDTGKRKKEKEQKEEEREGEESCVVAVRGYGTMSEETLELYFENYRKSGGQDVQSCTVDEKEKVVYVTFKSTEVAKRVSEKRNHTLGGYPLSVSLHRIRPSCPDRVFLTGVPALVSKESLINFLEARTKLSVRDVLYGEAEGTALVTFGEKYDIVTLEETLKQRKLEGSEVKARPVAVSDAVLVRGVSPAITKDALELYFDNTRKSGGEDVQGVEKLGEGTWLVSFAQHQVAGEVCKRAHSLGGANLQVSLYVDCLGAGGGDSDPWSFPIPPALSIPGPQPYLLRFVRESPSQSQAFREVLAQRHAQAKMDDVTGLTVTCTLTRETRHGKRLAKTWTEDVESTVGEFLGQFKTTEIRMSPTVFAEVAKDANKFQANGDEVAVYIESRASTIVVVGCPSAMRPIVKAVTTVEKQHEAELETKRQTVEETITTLRHYQLLYLSAVAFPQKAMQKDTRSLLSS